MQLHLKLCVAFSLSYWLVAFTLSIDLFKKTVFIKTFLDYTPGVVKKNYLLPIFGVSW